MSFSQEVDFNQYLVVVHQIVLQLSRLDKIIYCLSFLNRKPFEVLGLRP